MENERFHGRRNENNFSGKKRAKKSEKVQSDFVSNRKEDEPLQSPKILLMAVGENKNTEEMRKRNK